MFKTKDAASRVKNVLSPAYWTALCSDLSITSDAKIRSIGNRTRTSSSCIDHFKLEGYFQADLHLPESLLTRMRNCLEVLMANDWPPVFAFLYDQFWYPSRSPWLNQFLSRILGPGYQQRPNVWCHYVGSDWQTAGWPPHVDDVQKGITMWYALTDSTLDNGCLYLIPKKFTPLRSVKRLMHARSIQAKEASMLLQSARALPVNAGTALGWDFQTVHWGSASKIHSQPRISISHEFIHPDRCSKKERGSLLNPQSNLPNFKERLRLIAKSMIEYRKFEVRMKRQLALAKAILSETAV